jgi:ring-1,2-phenylacetyl-CoA epoxidase subunit PaaB
LDTQWPRYVVFQQDAPDAPYHYDGSVHAPDAELALLNARDVFTRRPDCIGLWVVRADRIFSRTAEELSATPLAGSPPGQPETYVIFQKRDHKGMHAWVGEVDASSPEGALIKALDTFAADLRSKAIVWWVIPSRAITRSSREDLDALFQMSGEPRFYREQNEFKTITALRKAASRTEEKSPDAS